MANVLSLPIAGVVFTVLLLGAATFTDLRWRRIPNYLTFPAIGFGLVLHLVVNGWEGLLLSLGGMIAAPLILVLVHLGRGIGMGDIKLAAALGALMGPILGALAMLLSMIAGGFLAIAWMMKEWGYFGHGSVKSGVSRALTGKTGRADDETGETDEPIGKMTIPYGVAISCGTLLTLVVSLWTG